MGTKWISLKDKVGSSEGACILGDILKGPSVQMGFQRKEEETSLSQELLSVICVLGRASAQTGP